MSDVNENAEGQKSSACPSTDAEEEVSNALVVSEGERLQIIERRKRLAVTKKRIQAMIQYHVPKFDSRSRARKLNEKTRRSIVLFEQDYHGLMREIIERDYFPDLERMRKQMEVVKLREQGFNEQADTAEWQLHQLLERGRRREKDRGLSVSTFVNRADKSGWNVIKKVRRMQDALQGSYTPAIRGIEDSEEPRPLLPLDQHNDKSVQIDLPNSQRVNVNVDAISLDQFHRKFTSEDNASFNYLMVQTEEKNAQKHAWMVEAAEKQNLKTLALRLSTDPSSRMEAFEEPKALESSERKKLNAILYGHEMSKGMGDDQKRREFRVEQGLETAPDEVLAVISAGEHSKEMRVYARNEKATSSERPNGLITARVEPKSALYFPPSAKKATYSEPKMISTSSTRLPMQRQRDDVLKLGMIDESDALRKAKQEYDRMSNEVRERVDHWLLHGGTVPEGVEFLQRGKEGEILQQRIRKTLAERELGYEFMAENERELLGRDLADQVLEKRRRERFSATESGRKEKGEALKSVLMTPASSLMRSHFSTPFGAMTGSNSILRTGNRSGLTNASMMYGTTPAGQSTLPGAYTPSPGLGAVGMDALNPFMMNSDLIRNYVHKSATGPLSTARSDRMRGLDSRQTTGLRGDSTHLADPTERMADR